MAHLNPVCMAPFMFAKFLPTTEAIRTKVDTVSYGAGRIGTLDSDGMGKIGQTPITLCLHARRVRKIGNMGRGEHAANVDHALDTSSA